MSPVLAAVLLMAAAYLVGAIPFGYLIARARGVDLFQAGSGNIGATNVGRVLGRKWGILVFLFDFTKGALPVALTPWVILGFGTEAWPGPIDLWRPCVALAALIGHLAPIYLRFRGGKGVATGFGAVCMLVPGPAFFAIAVWVAAVASFRVVSVGSLLAAVALCLARCLSVEEPLHGEALYPTLFCFAGAAVVIVKHRTNLARLRRGAENQLEARPMFDFLQRALHLVALGLWLGSAVFFSFLAAPKIFASFAEVAAAEPGDRTAYVKIHAGLDDARKKELGSALAGAAVGPIFPLFFGLQASCAVIALMTALGWWRSAGRVHRWRIIAIGLGLATLAAGWPISLKVSELRLARFAPDPAAAAAAREAFAGWHLVSLSLSFITTVLAFAAMVMAARLPPREDSCASSASIPG